MKNLFLYLVFMLAVASFAQDTIKNKVSYNRWSIEVNAGQNKPIRPFSTGYYSANPSTYFYVNGIQHFDVGTRYMLSPLFGLKIDFAYDDVKNNSKATSFIFESKQYRFGFQGIANVGRILKFESFTNRLGLLGHAGVQVSILKPQMGINAGRKEQDGGVIFGLTPQFRITNSFILTGDFSIINNLRQHFNWDGTYSAENNNLTGLMYNTSLGLTLYFGEKEKHADWYLEQDKQKELLGKDDLARKRLDEIETMLSDNDKDGVPDYLDFENNTPNGVLVDTRGRFIDLNKNGVPDEMERDNSRSQIIQKSFDNSIQNNLASDVDVLKSLVVNGSVNIFFDTNVDYPNIGSTNSVFQIIQFLRKYPQSKIKLTGYADISGTEAKNKNLSQRRAETIRKLLIDSGISANRVSIDAYGVDKRQPTSKTGLDLARRVSVEINN